MSGAWNAFEYALVLGKEEIWNRGRDCRQRRSECVGQLKHLDVHIVRNLLGVFLQRDNLIDLFHRTKQRHERGGSLNDDLCADAMQKRDVADELNRISKAVIAANEDGFPTQRLTAPYRPQVQGPVVIKFRRNLPAQYLITDRPGAVELTKQHPAGPTPLCGVFRAHPEIDRSRIEFQGFPDLPLVERTLSQKVIGLR